MQFPQPITLARAAELLQCRYAGPADLPITGLNEIHRVQPGEVTFVDVPKYYDKALDSPATTILINQEVEVPPGKGLLITEQPFQVFNQLGEHFRPEPDVIAEGAPQLGPGVQMGRNVVIGKDVEIGAGTVIGHHVVIGSHVRIGAHCTLYPQVTINDHCYLGDHVCVNANTVIGSEAFYFKSYPDRKEKFITRGRVVIHDHVDIGSNCSIDRGVTADTGIGTYSKLDNLIQVGHDTTIGERCILAGQVGLAGVSQIGNDVVLQGKAVVVKDVTLGDGAVVNMASVVTRSLPGGKTYYGWMAQEARQTLREIAAVRRLPDLMRKLDKLLKNS